MHCCNYRLGFEGCYDFFYLPMATWQDLSLQCRVMLSGVIFLATQDMRNKNSVGYAFINFRDPAFRLLGVHHKTS